MMYDDVVMLTMVVLVTIITTEDVEVMMLLIWK